MQRCESRNEKSKKTRGKYGKILKKKTTKTFKLLYKYQELLL